MRACRHAFPRPSVVCALQHGLAFPAPALLRCIRRCAAECMPALCCQLDTKAAACCQPHHIAAGLILFAVLSSGAGRVQAKIRARRRHVERWHADVPPPQRALPLLVGPSAQLFTSQKYLVPASHRFPLSVALLHGVVVHGPAGAMATAAQQVQFYRVKQGLMCLANDAAGRT
jgi:hypothetical protein